MEIRIWRSERCRSRGGGGEVRFGEEAVEYDGLVASLDVVEHLGGGEPDRAAGQRQLDQGTSRRPAPA
jgi:hypothetical protein